MILTRRNFLGGLLLVPLAPAIVRAESLMKIRPIAEVKKPADLVWTTIKQWWVDSYARHQGHL